MESSDAPGVRGEPGGHRASGRGRDLPDAHFFFADPVLWVTKRNLPKPMMMIFLIDVPDGVRCVALNQFRNRHGTSRAG